MINLRELGRTIRRKPPQETMIGRTRILLPPGSMLNAYKAKYKRYDQPLGDIANAIHDKYPGCCAIDIGANVGDTAALIRNKHRIPVLCVEGDRSVVEILTANLAALGEGISVEPSFVGPKGMFVESSRIDDSGKNASLIGALADSGVAMRPVDDILDTHPAFSSAKLLKTDCEGFDFEILESAYRFISSSRPVLFMEYAPTFRPESPGLGPKLLKDLISLGYEKFLFYDNYGCFMTSIDSKDWSRFEELHAYLLANEASGTVIYYFDICAFHGDDTDLACKVREDELRMYAR